MSSSPLVSVIIPVYNRSNVIGRAIESVLAQTFSDFDVIVCNDGSTDNTASVVEEFSDPRVKLVGYENNRGRSVARNTAMEQSQSKYLAFLDSDDEWLPEKLQKQIAAFESAADAVGVCFTGGTISKTGQATASYRPKKEWEANPYRDYALDRLSYLTPAIMIRRDCFLKVGGMDARLARGEDGDFLLRIFRFFGLVTVPDELVKIHMEVDKNTGDQNREAALLKCQKHRAQIRSDLGWYCERQFVANRYWNAMVAEISNKNYVSSLKYFVQSSITMPMVMRSHWRAAMSALFRSLKG